VLKEKSKIMAINLKTNTVLYTKDGSMVGNAIVLSKEDSSYLIKTDYGNLMRLHINEIKDLYTIGSIDLNHKYAKQKSVKYINKLNGKVAVIISDKATGMCNQTLGSTIVIYKYEEEDYPYPYVMEHKYFCEKHEIKL
jgi:hypothetical protein